MNGHNPDDRHRLYRMIAHINIGSNIGDSRSLIERAVADVFMLSDGEKRRSGFVESEPWGFHSSNRFLNIGVEIETVLPPLVLLHKLQEIEHAISPSSHRNKDGSYRDRMIDIDLIFMAEFPTGTGEGPSTLHLDLPALTLPHPRARERDFVIIPIKELHPGIKDPGILLE